MPGRVADQIPSEKRKGAKRCTHPSCEFFDRWRVRTKNGSWLCTGRGCHRIYADAEVARGNDKRGCQNPGSHRMNLHS